MCEELEKYLKWYQETATEIVESFRKHATVCSECQEWIMSQKKVMLDNLSVISNEDKNNESKRSQMNTCPILKAGTMIDTVHSEAGTSPPNIVRTKVSNVRTESPECIGPYYPFTSHFYLYHLCD